MARFFNEIWIPLTMLLLAAVVSLIPVAWSVDMDVHENVYDLTPVSAIESDLDSDHAISPAVLNGAAGVDQIQSLELKPAVSSPSPVESKQLQQQSVKPEQPVSNAPALAAPYMVMSPMPTFLILPVLPDRSRNKAFGDSASMVATTFANELADALAAQKMNMSVLNPLYAIDTLQDKGAYSDYQRLMDDYKVADQPDSQRLFRIVDKLSSNTQTIMWVVFVEADVDVNEPDAPHTKIDKALQIVYARQPRDPKYFIHARIKIYSTADGTPLVWQSAYSDYVLLGQFKNFTSSVFDDVDSYRVFKQKSSIMARKAIASIPPATYGTSTAIQANIIPNDPLEMPDADPTPAVTNKTAPSFQLR